MSEARVGIRQHREADCAFRSNTNEPLEALAEARVEDELPLGQVGDVPAQRVGEARVDIGRREQFLDRFARTDLGLVTHELSKVHRQIVDRRVDATVGHA